VAADVPRDAERAAFIQRWMSSRIRRSAELDGQVIEIPAREIVAMVELVMRGNNQ
jgi:hypothetical protein